LIYDTTKRKQATLKKPPRIRVKILNVFGDISLAPIGVAGFEVIRLPTILSAKKITTLIKSGTMIPTIPA
jgi:hypothetical protein